MSEPMKASRRGFMFGAGALLFADPKLILSRTPIIWGDGLHDDWEGIQALLDGHPVKIATGDTFAPGRFPALKGGTFLIGRGLKVPPGGQFSMTESHLLSAPQFKGRSMIEAGHKSSLHITKCIIRGSFLQL